MRLLKIRWLFLIGCFCLPFYPCIGQEDKKVAPFRVKTECLKSANKIHDTVIISVENISNVDRGFVIEFTRIGEISESESSFYGQLYTAYFNSDKSFFRKLKKTQRLSRKDGVGYIVPDSRLIPYTVDANQTKVLRFSLSGQRLSDPIILKVRIVPDIIDSEPDYIIESKPFNVYIKPRY
ncbi:MAG: hypothetical protein MUE38_02590 [Flavihumibacter sp.]|jgi:hypothetical protein|nr:hypothetical protein [Flavihumibacter sp.]